MTHASIFRLGLFGSFVFYHRSGATGVLCDVFPFLRNLIIVSFDSSDIVVGGGHGIFLVAYTMIFCVLGAMERRSSDPALRVDFGLLKEFDDGTH